MSKRSAKRDNPTKEFADDMMTLAQTLLRAITVGEAEPAIKWLQQLQGSTSRHGNLQIEDSNLVFRAVLEPFSTAVFTRVTDELLKLTFAGFIEWCIEKGKLNERSVTALVHHHLQLLVEQRTVEDKYLQCLGKSNKDQQKEYVIMAWKGDKKIPEKEGADTGLLYLTKVLRHRSFAEQDEERTATGRARLIGLLIRIFEEFPAKFKNDGVKVFEKLVEVLLYPLEKQHLTEAAHLKLRDLLVSIMGQSYFDSISGRNTIDEVLKTPAHVDRQDATVVSDLSPHARTIVLHAVVRVIHDPTVM